MRVVLNHPFSKVPKFRKNDKLLWERIEDFLKEGKYRYALADPEDVYNGIMMWLPDVGPRDHKYPTRDEEIKSISDLGKFLFEELKLNKTCLHFVFTEICVNGEGKREERWQAIEEVVFEELTGEILPKDAQAIHIKKEDIRR
jgi:hypothetical protein